jgi:hypothetical protein
MIPIKFVPIYVMEYLMTQVSPDVMECMQKEIDAIEASGFDTTKYTSMSKDLVGAIEREFELTESRDTVLSFLNQHIIPHYLTRFMLPQGEYMWSTKYNDRAFWVNFQDKNEYNPIHKHDGEISFVIWVKIPFLIEDEERKSYSSGKFHFHTQADQGMVHHTIAADRTLESYIVMFPSHLHHSVTPFTTGEGYRISVAGNLVRKT